MEFQMNERIAKTIVIMGTLDTKGFEVGYLRDKIREKGFETIVIDPGIIGKPQTESDVSREEVAHAGGTTLDELQRMAEVTSDRMELMKIMIAGASEIVRGLYEGKRLNGILSVGGSMGMAIGVSSMKSLPLGVPKLMVGTHFYPQYLGESDLTLMQSPTDIMGLNPVTNLILSQAAGAICAMAEENAVIQKSRPLIAMTGLGVTTQPLMALQRILSSKGYDTVVFHGNSEMMDQLVERDLIDGILDFSPNELLRIFIIEETPWRASRLNSAGAKGIPQLFVPGSLDMIVLRMAREKIPPVYADRSIYQHGPHITGVRTNKEEMKKIARILSDKLNHAKGPVTVVIPTEGFSALDRKGFSFHDPETDDVLSTELKRLLGDDIDFIECDAHLFDDVFVEEVAKQFDTLMKRGIHGQG